MTWTHSPYTTFYRYEDMLQDKTQFFLNIKKNIGLDYDQKQIENAIALSEGKRTRKNKAITGRGQQLPQKIKEKIKRYSKFYNNTDMSLIGL